MTPMRILLLTLIVLAGCGGKEPPKESASAEEIRKEWERGPLKVRFFIQPKEPMIIDPIRLTIEAEIEKDFELKRPAFGEGLGEFAIRDWREEKAKDENGKTLFRNEYELEVFLSGEYEIGPMVFSFKKKPGKSAHPGPEKASEKPETSSSPGEDLYKLKTESVKIEVASLEEDSKAIGTLEPPAGPEDLPEPASALLWYLLAGTAGAAALGALLLFGLRGRLRRVFVPPPPPPHEIAYRELKALIDEDLVGAGKIKEFYFRLTFIVRQYIERRFGLRAPERTTEEFLQEAAGSGVLSVDHQALLRDFLNHADLVKYAKYDPEAEDIERSFEAARRFINETRPQDEKKGGSRVSA